MARNYQDFRKYEKIIIEKFNKGENLRSIGEQYGFTYQQMRNFKTRYNKKQRMLESGKTIHKKGRPSKSNNKIPPSIQRLDKLAQMRYVMASKDRYIKRLEMENELIRDFLSHTERK